MLLLLFYFMPLCNELLSTTQEADAQLKPIWKPTLHILIRGMMR